MVTNVALVMASLVSLAWTALAIRLFLLTRGPWFRFLGPVESEWTIDHPPSVTAIVPARNEEAHVEATVAALRSQDYPDLAITLIDDESTDSTLFIVRRLAAESPEGVAPLQIVEGTGRPPGWVGKTWAVHQGATLVRSEWLWFVDADMGLDPRALTTALAEANRTGADFVSLLPGVRCETGWQTTVAISFLHILAHLFALDRVNDPSRPEVIAAGGFILIRRSLYEKIGGHEAIRHAIVEDIALARAAKQAGGRLAVRLAPSLAWTHMYGSFRAIWVGMRKNAYAGMDYQPHKYVVGAIVALTLAWGPIVAILVGFFQRSALLKGVGVAGIVAQVLATIPNLVFVGAKLLYALTLPIGVTTYVAIATASAWHYHRGRVLWKDRTIDASSVLGPIAPKVPKNQPEQIRGQFEQKRR